VFGCVLNAAITVWITTMMNVKSKTWEIGILRAHGVGDRDVLGIFGTQGLLVGAGAFAVAAVAVWLLEPILRAGVSYAFSLKAGGVLTGSPFEPSLWWLPATVLAVSVGFSLVGVLLPAVFACRLSPVEAMRAASDFKRARSAAGRPFAAGSCGRTS
jgi:ABC-type lipoprotein release transport system permease subunit